MGQLEKDVERIVREGEELQLAEGLKQYEANKAQAAPGSYWSTQPFNEAQYRLATDARDKLVRGLCLALFACKEGTIERAEMKGYSSHPGEYGGDSRALGEACCRSKQAHGVWVDMGLSLLFQGHAGIRLSGNPEEVRKGKSAPRFVLSVLGLR